MSSDRGNLSRSDLEPSLGRERMLERHLAKEMRRRQQDEDTLDGEERPTQIDI